MASNYNANDAAAYEQRESPPDAARHATRLTSPRPDTEFRTSPRPDTESAMPDVDTLRKCGREAVGFSECADGAATAPIYRLSTCCASGGSTATRRLAN